MCPSSLAPSINHTHYLIHTAETQQTIPVSIQHTHYAPSSVVEPNHPQATSDAVSAVYPAVGSVSNRQFGPKSLSIFDSWMSPQNLTPTAAGLPSTVFEESPVLNFPTATAFWERNPSTDYVSYNQYLSYGHIQSIPSLESPSPMASPNNMWAVAPEGYLTLHGTDEDEQPNSGERAVSPSAKEDKSLAPSAAPKASLSNSPNSTVALGGIKSRKQRLPCLYDGCKQTFPRKYELNRHQSSVHSNDIALLCPIYGCKRVAIPFPRLDKFREHIRKHHNPKQFLCMIENCGIGPFTHDVLKDHLNTRHNLRSCQQPHLKDTLAAVGLRLTQLRDGAQRIEDINNCPLAFLGCSYHSKPRGPPPLRFDFDDHLDEHELIDCSKGYEAIISVVGYWYYGGTITCPVCKKPVADKYLAYGLAHHKHFLGHMDGHSKEERNLHAKEVSEMLRLYRSRPFWPHLDQKILERILGELEEVGVLPAEESE
jgi:hypothetical protein